MMLEFLLCTGEWVGYPVLGNQVEEQVGERRSRVYSEAKFEGQNFSGRNSFFLTGTEGQPRRHGGTE